MGQTGFNPNPGCFVRDQFVDLGFVLSILQKVMLIRGWVISFCSYTRKELLQVAYAFYLSLAYVYPAISSNIIFIAVLLDSSDKEIEQALK